MVVTRHRGKTTLTVRGPETRATPAHSPEDAEFFGIQFKLGTFLSELPAGELVDGALTLPEATRRSVWFNGSAWQIPDYDDADAFVERLERTGMLVRDPVVSVALAGQVKGLSSRSVQRRFLRATGLTQRTVYQIERARLAKALLERGLSIADVIYQTGYADQPHLTRSLGRLVGQTPAQIVRASGSA
jgi:AraC-like DNA-binding protein